MKNKLISIIPVWDGMELLPYLIKNIQHHVDMILIIHSTRSNYGRFYMTDAVEGPAIWFNWEPSPRLTPHQNERSKRNFGLNLAIAEGATHILMQDVDELYMPDDFEREKERIYRDDLNGLVCGLNVYFKEPTLWCEDHTLVPFIQKVTPGLQFGSFRNYPFAYDKKGNAHIDPTRRTNQTRRIEWSEIKMHHYSWVRADFQRKINNSSARNNLLKSTIMKDLQNAAPGYYCEFYRQTLKECDNHFNIKI